MTDEHVICWFDEPPRRLGRQSVEQRRRFLTAWRLAAAREIPAFQLANLLAAEAAHNVALARRLALLDVLRAARRPLVATELIARVEARLDSECWGNVPQRTLHDDVRRLKEAGYKIRYRRGQRPGYVWSGAHGAVDSQAVSRRIEPADAAYVRAVANLTPREKLERAAEMARWTQALQAQTQGAGE
jgi:DNA-binding transcriptional ArsR family regulator